MRLALVACVLLLAGVSVDAFTGSAPLRAEADVRGRAAAGAVCLVAPEPQQYCAMSAAPLARRSFLATSLVSVVGVQRVATEGDAEQEVEAGGPEEVVVEEEMRHQRGAGIELRPGFGNRDIQ